MEEAPNKIQEEYLQLHFIQSLYSDRFPLFEESLLRSNAVVQMSQQLPHLKISIVEEQKLSHMSGLADT